jgi:hypothetical protein
MDILMYYKGGCTLFCIEYICVDFDLLFTLVLKLHPCRGIWRFETAGLHLTCEQDYLLELDQPSKEKKEKEDKKER